MTDSSPHAPTTDITGLPALLANREPTADGVPSVPVVVVDLDADPDPSPSSTRSAAAALRGAEVVAVGVTGGNAPVGAEPVIEALACTLTTVDPRRRCEVRVADLHTEVTRLAAGVTTNPCAALAGRRLVELADGIAPRAGLTAESFAYSMLLAGPEFSRWRHERALRAVPAPDGPAVRLRRLADTLYVTLNVPERRNAFSRWMRDDLVAAFDLALADPTIERVVLDGAGPAFCSGGDLDEFGTSRDVGAAHLIRLQAGVAARIEACRDRVEVRLHGACIGAGIELASFAGRVVAAADTVVRLPELSMGLVPGAGGTVGLTRRIGRWRTSYLFLTGARVDLDTGLSWGCSMSAREAAARLVAELAGPLGAPVLEVPDEPATEAGDWAASGALGLTGSRFAPPLTSPGRPATATRAALRVASVYLDVELPGVEVLGERAGLAGWTRNAPWSVGGAFRTLAAADGWLGLSIARPWDRAALPALVGGPVGPDPWAAVARWVKEQPVHDAEQRAIVLGLAAAAVPPRALPERRRPVEVTVGTPRRAGASPVVVDLTSLWAGPLCARLLGLGGARVIKIESPGRPDGARLGAPELFRRLHRGHDLVGLDIAARPDELRALIAGADVVLEASRPRALEQLGISVLEAVHRGVIWASITAYGRQGPDGARVGFGDDVAVGAGLYTRVNGHPVPVGDAVADPLAGVHAAAAVAVALRGRRGCLLDVSMHDVCRRAAASPSSP